MGVFLGVRNVVGTFFFRDKRRERERERERERDGDRKEGGVSWSKELCNNDEWHPRQNNQITRNLEIKPSKKTIISMYHALLYGICLSRCIDRVSIRGIRMATF